MKEKEKHLDLFSGIGGFALAARWAGFETVQFVELEPFAQKVLTKNFPGVPIHGDIKTFQAAKFRGCKLITGGYPCQPFSHAGQRRGEEDDRHLWPEMFRVIREARPTWILCENVAGHITMGLDDVLSDLEGEGYACQTFVIPAVAKDARHRRDRVWIVANSQGSGDRGGPGNMAEKDGPENRGWGEAISKESHNDSEDVANTFNNEQCVSSGPGSGQQSDNRQTWREMGSKSYRRSDEGREEDAPNSNSIRCGDTLERQDQIRLSECRDKQAEGQWDVANSKHSADRTNGGQEGEEESIQVINRKKGCGGLPGGTGSNSGIVAQSESRGETGRDGVNWLPEPSVGRVANGIPNRVDRLKGLGNAIVPQVAYEIMRCLK